MLLVERGLSSGNEDNLVLDRICIGKQQVVPGCVHGILVASSEKNTNSCSPTIVEIGLFVKPVVSDGAIGLLSDQEVVADKAVVIDRGDRQAVCIARLTVRSHTDAVAAKIADRIGVLGPIAGIAGRNRHNGGSVLQIVEDLLISFPFSPCSGRDWQSRARG